MSAPTAPAQRSWRACAALWLVAAAVACAREGSQARGSAGAPAPAERAEPERQVTDALDPLPSKLATLYFPAFDSGMLRSESREILATRAAEDLAKQVLSDLLAGPLEEGLESAVPAGTRLLQVYVLRDGTAYADFSAELRTGLAPGSDPEILTVYAIVNSLTVNIPEINRVGILIEGRRCRSLNGHLSLDQPLRPDWQTVESGAPDEQEPRRGRTSSGTLVRRPTSADRPAQSARSNRTARDSGA